MGELITIVERSVPARGFNPSALPNEEKVRSFFFREVYGNVALLETITPSDALECTLLYPACGADVLYPLLFLERLFPKLKNVRLLFNDILDERGMIKTILDEVGIPFSEKKGKIFFYWRSVFVELKFVIGNIFLLIDSAPPFDVYFERAFRIMKEEVPGYEQKVFEKLSLGGLLISDSGFCTVPLQRFDISPALSSYGEMVIGRKG